MTAAPRITPGDRLASTLALSLILHGVVLLGVGFTVEQPAPVVPTLDVILTQTRSETPAEKADFLAQSSQQGGGDSDTAERPREPQSSPVPKPDDGVAPAPLEASAPRPAPPRPEPVVSTTRASDASSAEPAPDPVPEIQTPTTRELVERSMELARLSAELDQQRQLYAKRPRRKFLSASTQEYEYAAYMRAWVARVERVGNLNYPDEARRRKLEGQLVMTVAVRRDGTIESIDIIEPSGHPILDEAAVRIVRLAEPFAPIPNTSEAIEILHITRTWQFLPGGVLRNR